MDAVEFLKLRRRYFNESSWNPNMPDGSSPYADDETIERYVARVEQWGREHPKETRQSKFLKLFPDAPIVDGTILVCPKIILLSICIMLGLKMRTLHSYSLCRVR